MKNIFHIFLNDTKRIFTNVVAIVIIIGLCIIPSLYAWFNILSNWDPYGETATHGMHISVYSDDHGTEILGNEVNIGETVIGALKGESKIGWVFCDSIDDAMNRVYSGECYAALVIPEDFSANLLSFLSGNPKETTIDFYINDKKNAVATKITGKVKKEVQAKVNSTFVSKISQILTASGEMLFKDNEEGVSLIKDFNNKLKDLDNGLTAVISVVDSITAFTGSAKMTAQSAGMLFPALNSLLDTSNGSLSSMSGSLQAADSSTQVLAELLNAGLDSAITRIDDLADFLEEWFTDANVTTMSTGELSEVMESTGTIIDSAAFFLPEGDEALEQAKESQAALQSFLEEFRSRTGGGEVDVNLDIKGLIRLLRDCSASLRNLKDRINNELTPGVRGAIATAQQAIVNSQKLLSGMKTDFTGLKEALSSYKEAAAMGSAGVTEARNMLGQLQTDLRKLIKEVDQISDDGDIKKFMNLWADDPEALASYIAAPITIEKESFFPIENYGSAMSPFYTVLALWVGALILSAIFRVKVDLTGVGDGVRRTQTFFGRYILFFLIGQVTAALTITGDLLFVHIQCVHPLLLYLAGAVISFVFTLFIYAMTVGFGNIGQAIVVIIMVIQVAGAGGTFPIEVLPGAYRAIYGFLPFVYAMDAMRECVGGLYQNDYWKDLLVLLTYVPVSLLLGLVLGRPFKKLLNSLEESKKKAGFFI